MSFRTLPVIAACAAVLAGCAAPRQPGPPLRDIYSRSAQEIGARRNPVIVIPGILGSRLVNEPTGQVVWGAFTYGAADTDTPGGARLFALPMRQGAPLSELRDEVVPDGVLESLEADVSFFRITALEPYRGIIAALAAGRYVDRDIALASARRADAAKGPVDYAGLHFTCFQFDYDWRRDISENAARLHELIRIATDAARAARETDEPVKVDVVAHSMGGLVLMYYLRYGPRPLPDDGSIPPATWEGAALVDRAFLVATPNAGSVQAMRELLEGVRFAPIVPEYRPAVIGTLPAVYQLLPRERHARLVHADSGTPITGLYDPATWEANGWGLADPRQDRYLAWLLPETRDPVERRRIALDHLAKCLARAEQLHRALDAPMTGPDAPPPGLTLSLVLGDADATPAVLAIDPRSARLSNHALGPGDGTVTRDSALMDERVGSTFDPRLRSPIPWSAVHFVPADHIALTDHPSFVNQLLFDLLERPR